MTDSVPRTVSVVEEGPENYSKAVSRPLAAYWNCPAYVLLGSPGAGKTTAFRQEADAHENGEFVSARDFMALDDPERPDKLLFIDGLDEVRAGVQDGRMPIDQIRNKLQGLGCPKFRLSCRTIDWWGTNDRKKLEQLGTDVLVLEIDPLTGESITEVLRRRNKPKHGNPEEFVRRAHEHGLGEWLANPQTLLQLADFIDEQGGWPRSRRDLYEKACETLLSETNEEHFLSGADPIDPDALSKAAGRMCAVQLLSGAAGWTLPLGRPNEDYPFLQRIISKRIGKQVARTRAFSKIPGRDRVVPEHRCTAEFLGGRYLAKRVEQGLSADRILALMSSADKAVVPKLHGLAAWFATYSRPARKKLIEGMPLEIILYGDVESFSTEDKLLLFDQLREKTDANPECVGMVRRSASLPGLASPDLHEYLKEALSQPALDFNEQSFRYLVLKALHCSPVLPEISDSLPAIIRGEESWPANKELALDILMRSCADDAETGDRLKELLAEIREGAVRDLHGELLDTVLAELFPQHISVEETLDCLMTSGQPATADFHFSWARRFVEQLRPEQLSDALNKMVVQVNDARQSYLSRASFRPFRAFLAILQNLFSPAPSRGISLLDLRHWLETAWRSEIQHTVPSFFEQTKSSVHEWFRLQPDKHREIFKGGVEEWIGADDFKLRAHETGNWLFGLEPTPDFWPWCLELAIQSRNPEAAEFYLRQVLMALFDGNTGTNLSLDDIQARVARHPKLDKILESMLKCDLPEGHFKDIAMRQKLVAMDLHEQEQAHQNWIAEVKTHETELRENRGPQGLLHKLAFAYFGGFHGAAGDQPRERIGDLLDNDSHLVQLVLESFINSISRKDAPSVGDIIRHAKQGEPHPLTLPSLAGLEETGEPPSTDQHIRRALAFHYFANYPLPGEVSPTWYESLLDQRPELVAAILIRRIRLQMRNGKEFLTDSHKLAFSTTHAKVANAVALPLLKSFPIRCTNQQLYGLGHLLAAALLHCKRVDLQRLLKEKLAAKKTKSMNIGQQVYWLAARFLISPETHRRPLESYLHDDEQRKRYFAGFVCQGGTSPEWNALLKGKCLVPLIQLLGSSFQYLSWAREEAWRSPPMAASDTVCALINHLAGDPSPTATESLKRLVVDASLAEWKTHLQDAIDKQRSLRRQSEFKHCGVEEIVQALDKKKPANMDDLVVILLEEFDEMSKKIRGGSTNDWHQYWNQSPQRSPEEWSPKVEADCRDAFLSDLQEKLKPFDIHADREGAYADDMKADIQVSYKSLNLPIEVKRNSAYNLWQGINEQLIPKYSRDPDADGRGIYLVFWFGEEFSTRNPKAKTRPTSPEELQRQLERALTPEEAAQISIRVIDVARP